MRGRGGEHTRLWEESTTHTGRRCLWAAELTEQTDERARKWKRFLGRGRANEAATVGDVDIELWLSGGTGDEAHVFRALLVHHSISQGLPFYLTENRRPPLPLHAVSHPFLLCLFASRSCQHSLEIFNLLIYSISCFFFSLSLCVCFHLSHQSRDFCQFCLLMCPLVLGP